MINMTRRVARLAGVTSLLAVIAIGLATPASAATVSIRNAGDTSSFGLKTEGLAVVGPFAASAFPAGPATSTLGSANVSGLLTTGFLATTANAGGASATVNNVNVTLSSISTLTATSVMSSCTLTDSGGVTGQTTIVDGVITTFLLAPILLQSSPAPNTTIMVTDVAGVPIATVVLNRQIVSPDGTLTVDAIFITLPNTQTITIASSRCTPSGAAIPMASGIGLALGGGLLGILILGYVIRHRLVSVPQAV